MGATLPYDTLAHLRRAVVDAVPHLGLIDDVPVNDWRAETPGDLGSGPFGPALEDHYLVNPIARASALMAELSANAKARNQTALAAE